MSEFILTKEHVVHGSRYIIQGKRVSSVCILCLIDRLTECPTSPGLQQLQQLSVFIKTVLGEINDLLNEQDVSIIGLIQTLDIAVLEKLCSALVGLFPFYQTDVHQLIISVITSIARICSEELQRIVIARVIHTISVVHNFSNTIGQMSLLGQLLHLNLSLSQYIIQAHGAVLWYFIEGLSYPDESIVSLIVYIFVQLCSSGSSECTLPLNIISELTRHLSSSLANSRQNDLTVNLMGLLQGLVRVPLYSQCLLEGDSPIALGIKRVLMSKDDTLQLSAVQCIQTISSSNVVNIRGLITSDLPVYLFEILSSDSDKLVSAVLDCLVSISSTFMELFTSSQTVFCYDALLDAMDKAVTVKNTTAVQSGILFLINLLNRPSLLLNCSGIVVDRILNIISASLQFNVLLRSCVIIFGRVINSDILHSQRKLTDFLPLLSSFIDHLPSIPTSNESSTDTTIHTSTPTTMSQDHIETIDVKDILLTCRNISKECYDRSCSSADGVIDDDIEEVFGFVMRATEMKLIPSTLVKITNKNQSSNERYSDSLEILLDLLTILFSLSREYSTHLAILLVKASFIQLVMEFKAKYERLNQFGVIANRFLEELCYQLVIWDTGSREEADNTREMVHIAIPNINCNHVNSLKLLLQRINPLASDCHSTSQKAVLFLFYYLERTHTEPTVLPELLFNTLHGYLSLNPEPHLLPPPSMKHLLALYISCSAVSTNKYQVINTTTGEDVLIQSVLKLSDPSLVFTSNISTIAWAYERQPLRNIAQQWIRQWLQCPEAIDRSDQLFESISSNHVLEDIINIVINGVGGYESALSILDRIISKQMWPGVVPHILEKVENALQSQNTNVNLESVFGVLAITPQMDNLKLFNQVICHLSNWCCKQTSDHGSIALLVYGLEICSKGLSKDSLIRVQVSNLLINDEVIINCALSLIGINSQVKLTLLCLQVMELLMEISHTECLFPISFTVFLRLLFTYNDVPAVQTQVIGLWSNIFSNNGSSNPFYITYDNVDGKRSMDIQKESLQIMAFILINLISKEGDLVLTKCSCKCLNLLLVYARNVKGIYCHQILSENWLFPFHHKMKMMFNDQSLMPKEYCSLVIEISGDEKLTRHLKDILIDNS